VFGNNLITITVLGSFLTGSSVPAYADNDPPLAALPSKPPIPADNKMTPEKIELGKYLYFDPRLSGDLAIACVDCHQPAAGWGDGSDICRGYPGTVHWRNCQTIVNSAYYAKLFWGGSSLSLEKQAKSAAQGGVAGNGEVDMMEERLAQIPVYVERFNHVFGEGRPTIGHAYQAIAAFERTIIQPDTPFDKFMLGNKRAISSKAKRGKRIFEGKARCIKCHNGALFSDEKYYNLGVPPNDGVDDDAMKQITFRFEHYAKGSTEEVYRKSKIDLGEYYVSKNKQMMGTFRTPSLRYIKYTAPYMHNGVFWDLEEVVDFYNQGGGTDQVAKDFSIATKSRLIKPLGLTNSEKEALLEFLETLSGPEIIIAPPKLPEYKSIK
jgi:cytochrome c peroxidase